MKKKLSISIILALLVLVSIVIVSSAQASEGIKPVTVTYHENNCLAKVPEDKQSYFPGDTVTVVFDPVEYTDNQIFYGWSFSPSGPAQFGYTYYTFSIPEKNVDLYAICIPAYYNTAPQKPNNDCRSCYSYCPPYPPRYGSIEIGFGSKTTEMWPVF